MIVTTMLLNIYLLVVEAMKSTMVAIAASINEIQPIFKCCYALRKALHSFHWVHKSN